MSSTLRSCPGCQRHVFERDAECPFCHTRSSAMRAAVAVAAIAVAAAACDKPPPQPAAPSADATATAPTATAPASAAPSAPPVKRGDQAPAPVYGGPPP